jgi:CheY-like chemotaxis protein
MNKAEGGSTFCILMVDDDPMIRSLGKAILERSGCQVEVSGSGREAVDAFARKRYDMIFMDCSMPGMDGYEATGVIREMENKNRGKSGASHVPIVAVTGFSTEEDKRHCLQAGMDDYLSKPFTIARLQSILDRWLFTRPAENRED